MRPVTRSDFTALILSTPPRAASALLTTSSAVCASARTGNRTKMANQSAFVFMNLLVDACWRMAVLLFHRKSRSRRRQFRCLAEKWRNIRGGKLHTEKLRQRGRDGPHVDGAERMCRGNARPNNKERRVHRREIGPVAVHALGFRGSDERAGDVFTDEKARAERDK